MAKTSHPKPPSRTAIKAAANKQHKLMGTSGSLRRASGPLKSAPNATRRK